MVLCLIFFLIYFFFFSGLSKKISSILRKVRNLNVELCNIFFLKIRTTNSSIFKSGYMLLCLKILIINIIVNNIANHLYLKFIRYKIRMPKFDTCNYKWYYGTIGMLEDNCYTSSIYSFRYNNYYFFGYNNYIYSTSFNIKPCNAEAFN